MNEISMILFFCIFEVFWDIDFIVFKFKSYKNLFVWFFISIQLFSKERLVIYSATFVPLSKAVNPICSKGEWPTLHSDLNFPISWDM